MKRLFVFTFSLMFSMMAWCNDNTTSLTISPFTINAGETIEVRAMMTSPYDDLCQAQFDLVLPDGISIPTRNGRYYVLGVPDGVIEYDGTSYSHQITAALQEDGSIRVICVSSSNTRFISNSGALVRIRLHADENIYSGEYPLLIKNIEFTHDNITKDVAEDSSTTISVFGVSLPGDVNKDDQISIADVTALVNIILGKDNTMPYLYDHDAADVNGDGNTSIADVTALVNIILGKE